VMGIPGLFQQISKLSVEFHMKQEKSLKQAKTTYYKDFYL
jgi:hypothetical protein